MRTNFFKRVECVDFETSGLDFDTTEIIEQGVSIYQGDGDWNVRSSLYNCKGDIPPEASAVHNLTKDMLSDLPLFTLDKSIFTDLGSIMVSHNAPFDSGIVKKYLPAEVYDNLCANWLCTLRLVRKLYANDSTFTAFNLSYLRYRLGLNVTASTDQHRAGYDSYITGLLLEHIVTELESRGVIDVNVDYLPQIQAWMKEPIIINLMPFGKHEGMPIDQVPLRYLEWCVSNTDRLDESSPAFDPDLAASIALVMYKKLGM